MSALTHRERIPKVLAEHREAWDLESDAPQDWLDQVDADLVSRLVREMYPRELVEAARDKVSDCQYCGGTGQLGAAWDRYKRYKAKDGSCRACCDLRTALSLYEETP